MWMLVTSIPFLFLPALTLVAFKPEIKYLVAKLTKVSKHLVLLWDTECCFSCSPEATLFFRFTQMNVAFIFITQQLIVCILQYPFHPLTMYDILKTPLFCKFKSSKNCEGSLELRGMIFLYYLFVWVIVKKSFFNIHTYKMFSLVFACFMCSISICTQF